MDTTMRALQRSDRQPFVRIPGRGRLRIVALMMLFTLGGVAHADTPPLPTNQVNLNASAEREIPNELFRVFMFTELRDRDPAVVATEINRQMAAAISEAKAVTGVKVKTGSYNTTPVYNYKSPGKEPVWQGSQDLVLESEDLQAVLKLAGTLQQTLKIRNVSYAVTPATRERILDELIEEAMMAFHRRAAVIGRHMPKTDYDIGEIHVGVGGSGRPPVYRAQMRKMDSGVMAAESGPAVEAGTTRLEVTVSGSVRY